MIMSQEKKKKNVLFEDFQVGSSNFLGVGGGPGQSAMSLKPGKVTLLDLLKQAQDWENEMGKAPNRLPFPLQDGLTDQLGQLYVDVLEVKNKVAQSEKNSIIKDNERASKAVKKIQKKLSVIAAAIKDIATDIDDISVGTSAPEYHA
jgi:hypothetical protein